MPIDIEKEKEFDEWLNSIEFIDENGNIVPPTLEPDPTPDPEGDRE